MAKKKKNTFGALLAFLGAIGLVAGVFLPWVRTNVDAGISGWNSSDDAKAVLGLAVAALLMGVAVIAGARNILIRLILIGLGIAAIVIAVVDIGSIGSDLPDALNAKFGAGLIVVPVAGVLLLLSGLFTTKGKS